MDLIEREQAMNIFAVDLAEKDRQVSYQGFCIDAVIAIGSLPSIEKGILIKDMEMPEHCGYCRFRYDGICHALQKTQYSMDECPLVKVEG